MKGMDMKGMDMTECKDMMDKSMEMKDMDMSKCMDMMGKDKKGKSAEKMSKGKPHKGVGTVEKVDPAAGTVTLAHGPVKSLNWPAMTMSFMVKDRALLEKVKPGAKVEFGFVESGKEYLITEIK